MFFSRLFTILIEWLYHILFFPSTTVLRRQILARHEPNLDHQDLENFRIKRQQEINARRVFVELLTYCVFAFVVLSISYIHTDQRSFLLKNNVNNILVQDSVTYNKFAKVRFFLKMSQIYKNIRSIDCLEFTPYL